MEDFNKKYERDIETLAYLYKEESKGAGREKFNVDCFILGCHNMYGKEITTQISLAAKKLNK